MHERCAGRYFVETDDREREEFTATAGSPYTLALRAPAMARGATAAMREFSYAFRPLGDVSRALPQRIYNTASRMFAMPEGARSPALLHAQREVERLNDALCSGEYMGRCGLADALGILGTQLGTALGLAYACETADEAHETLGWIRPYPPRMSDRIERRARSLLEEEALWPSLLRSLGYAPDRPQAARVPRSLLVEAWRLGVGGGVFGTLGASLGLASEALRPRRQDTTSRTSQTFQAFQTYRTPPASQTLGGARWCEDVLSPQDEFEGVADRARRVHLRGRPVPDELASSLVQLQDYLARISVGTDFEGFLRRNYGDLFNLRLLLECLANPASLADSEGSDRTGAGAIDAVVARWTKEATQRAEAMRRANQDRVEVAASLIARHSDSPPSP
ncbi:MAG: hypothetical protein IPK13_12435 [Deltaproteobacteria bacterium]|nr:hypothetical protein [Deltaproteobacteria bacterium]